MLRSLSNALGLTANHVRERAARANRSRLGVEALEARNLLANYLLIDYTPDAAPGERYQPGSFAEMFNLRYNDGTAPAFLDFNRDGYVSGADISVAAQSIANRVAGYFQQFDLGVWYGDLDSDSSMGQRWLAAGQSSADQVFVMYTGGRDPESKSGLGGYAFQPRVGYNNEYYAYTFTTNMALYYMTNQQNMTPERFRDSVANVIVHEFGHLVGLGHVYGNPTGDPNVMNYSADPSASYVPNAWYQYIEQGNASGQMYWSWQNPALELQESLSGQPDDRYFQRIYSRYEAPGHYKVTMEELMGDGHGGHEHGAEEHLRPLDLEGLAKLLTEERLWNDAGISAAVAAVHALGTDESTSVPETLAGATPTNPVASTPPARRSTPAEEDVGQLDRSSLPGSSLEEVLSV